MSAGWPYEGLSCPETHLFYKHFTVCLRLVFSYTYFILTLLWQSPHNLESPIQKYNLKNTHFNSSEKVLTLFMNFKFESGTLKVLRIVLMWKQYSLLIFSLMLKMRLSKIYLVELDILLDKESV